MALNDYSFLASRRSPLLDESNHNTTTNTVPNPIESSTQNSLEISDNELTLPVHKSTLPELDINTLETSAHNTESSKFNSLSLDDLLNLDGSREPTINEAVLPEETFVPPVKVNKSDLLDPRLKELLPSSDADPMFTLSRLKSGIGNLSVSFDGVGFGKLLIFVENADHTQTALSTENGANSAVSLIGQRVQINLAMIANLRRVCVIMQTPFNGAAKINSDVFEFQHSFGIRAEDSMYIVPVNLYVSFGKIFMRQTYISRSSARDAANCFGFNKIMWRDNNTPLY